MEQRLEDIGERFQELELEYMKTGEIEARAKLEKVRSSVIQKTGDVRNQLVAVRKAGDEALEEAKEGVTNAWSELSEAVEGARDALMEIKSSD